jgi:hypothetical protein
VLEEGFADIKCMPLRTFLLALLRRFRFPFFPFAPPNRRGKNRFSLSSSILAVTRRSPQNYYFFPSAPSAPHSVRCSACCCCCLLLQIRLIATCLSSLHMLTWGGEKLLLSHQNFQMIFFHFYFGMIFAEALMPHTTSSLPPSSSTSCEADGEVLPARLRNVVSKNRVNKCL